MDEKHFPMPTRLVRQTKDEKYSFRCKSELKERLFRVISDDSARADWVSDLLEYGLDRLESELQDRQA